MLGILAGIWLPCDNCIKYHLGKCFELGKNTNEMYKFLRRLIIVRCTIVIPHTPRLPSTGKSLMANNAAYNVAVVRV